MNCPSCASALSAITVGGHSGTKVDVDLCLTCQVIWFDHLESTRLSPGGTLHLFQMFGERPQLSPSPLKQPLKCPRCDLRLLFTHDRQRNTLFRYWRCGRGHGRLITFFDFLREKEFVRPLSPEQLEEVRANIQMINCSNCGAPIDLSQQSACAHCATPISMVDLKQIEHMAEHLRHAGEPSRTIDPMLPARLEREKREVEALFATLRASGQARFSSFGLVEVGLRLISGWIRG